MAEVVSRQGGGGRTIVTLLNPVTNKETKTTLLPDGKLQIGDKKKSFKVLTKRPPDTKKKTWQQWEKEAREIKQKAQKEKPVIKSDEKKSKQGTKARKN